MTTKKVMQTIILFIVGFLFLTVDTYVSTGISYPQEYQNNDSIIGEYQYYAIRAFYGADCTYKTLEGEPVTGSFSGGYYTEAVFVDQVFFKPFRIDIFNDVIGFILLALCCYMMKKQSQFFKAGFFVCIAAIGTKILFAALPCILNGMILCNMTLAFGISHTGLCIFTTFLIYKGYMELMQDSCCRDERIWLNTSWFSSMVLFLLILLLEWLELIALSITFTVVMVCLCFFMLWTIYRVLPFITRNTN